MFPFEAAVLRKKRKTLLAKAEGEVLEIGAGTGTNYKYYDYEKIKALTILDLIIKDSVRNSKIPHVKELEFVEGNVEKLPFSNESFDTVVFTLVFCSVDNPAAGLSEIHRVLKNGGKILFIEHVTPTGRHIKAVVDKLNPWWNTFTNGCNLNRNTVESIKRGGFEIEEKTFAREGVFVSGTGMKNK